MPMPDSVARAPALFSSSFSFVPSGDRARSALTARLPALAWSASTLSAARGRAGGSSSSRRCSSSGRRAPGAKATLRLKLSGAIVSHYSTSGDGPDAIESWTLNFTSIEQGSEGDKDEKRDDGA